MASEEKGNAAGEGNQIESPLPPSILRGSVHEIFIALSLMVTLF
jgi:hypothetical protein